MSGPIQLTIPDHPHEEEASVEITTSGVSIEGGEWFILGFGILILLGLVIIFKPRRK